MSETVACPVRDYLRMLSRQRKRSKQPDVEGFVLTHGSDYAPGERPADVPQMRMGDCFRNAFILAQMRRRLTYVEGWALFFIPTHHAWCIDAEGRVVDPTWVDDDPRFTELWAARCYVGVPFTLSFLYRQQVRTERWGVFHNVPLDEVEPRG
jgi:hypothetical protein